MSRVHIEELSLEGAIRESNLVVLAEKIKESDLHIKKPVKTILKQNDEYKPQGTQMPIPSNDFQVVRDGMRLSATEGVAKGLNTPAVKIAAKTGTAAKSSMALLADLSIYVRCSC